MSSLREMAEAEASQVESDEEEAAEAEANPIGDPAADDADDPEPDTEPSSNVTMEKALAAMERENERHAKAVAKIMGDDFELVHVCSGCVDFAAGFTLTPPDEAPPILAGDDFVRCAKCNGYGQVTTGALTEHGRTQTCLTCNGQGFITKAPEPMYAPPVVAQGAPRNADVVNLLRTQGYMVIEPPAPAPPMNAQPVG